MKACIFSLLWMFAYCSSLAQQPFTWRYTEEDGLPSMTIYDILVGKDKFIYLGTDAGCYRFDGLGFVYLPAIKTRSRGLTNAQYCKDNKIWYKNFSGQIFYLENDSLKVLESWERFGQAQDINYFAFDSQNRLWLQTTSGNVFYSNPEKTEFKALQTSLIQLSKKQVFSAVVHQDTLFASILQTGVVLVLDVVSNKGRLIDVGADIKSLYLGTSNGCVYAQESSGKREFFLWKNGFLHKNLKITHLLKDRRILNQTGSATVPPKAAQHFWIITNKGAFYINRDSSYFGILPDEAVTDAAQDYEGNYWFSTALDGLHMIPSLSVKAYTHENSHWKDSRITQLARGPQGSMFVGCYDGGLFWVDKNMRLLKEYKKTMGGGVEVEFLSFDSARSLLYTSKAIYHINQSEPIFDGYYIKEGVFFGDYAFVAASTFSGFIQMQDNADKTKLKYFFLNSPNVLKTSRGYWVLNLNAIRSRCVLFDQKKDEYWIGDSDGLKKYDSYARKTEIKDTSGAPIIAVSLSQHVGGTIAVSTMQQGIYVINNGQVTHHFTKKNGLKTDMGGKISLYEPTPGKIEIWQCTDRGIQFIDLQDQQIQFIDKRDGLGTDLVMDLLLIGDTVWAATNIGLLKLPRDLKEPNLVAPVIYLKSVKIKERDTLLSEKYVLNHTQNNIYISFQALSYKSHGSFKYKYRLLGLDTNWIYTQSSNNFARFLSLPYGSFLFEAKAINEDGTESQQPIHVAIEVLQPYWQKWWFLVLIFMATMLALTAVFLYILANIRTRNKLTLSKTELERDLRTSRLASLRAQMNPHFIFNALNSIQEFILLNDKKQANFYLGKFANLMRLVLDMSNQDKVCLEDEIKSLEIYLQLEALRFEEGFQYQINVEQAIDPHEIFIPPMLIQPYVENAIKHGLMHIKGEKKLEISFSIVWKNNKKMLGCTVEDNGIGRQKSKQLQANRTKSHASFATGATAKRLELLYYGRQVETLVEDLPQGTKVFITIPV